ncbi:hypothetical protein Q73_07350 [Bacillus coahuilensis m2-6]|uniref:GtrA family protein n=1 Tax=Bacillus coahuilensis TaxID=408580 RepID=UPI0001850C46|nr:GtrA family protein [Bacillus coahuilensis]KUP08168.1 hypothetical protein Q73_07350 [Bacillus coahuilensis m2-6]
MDIKQRYRSIKQFFSFTMIAVINAGIDLGTFNLLLILFPSTDNAWLVTYNTIAYILAVCNSYYWNSRLTFKYNANRQREWKQMISFTTQALVSLIISNVVFILSVELLYYTILPNWMIHNLSKFLSMGLSSLASFFFMKFYVFSHRQSLSKGD